MALHSVNVVRVVPAPVDRVWRAWTDGPSWSQWIGMHMTTDARCGGRFDNGVGEGGEYLAIVKPRLLRFTWELRRVEPGSFVEVHLAPDCPSATRCEVRHLQLHSPTDRDELVVGWNRALDGLVQWVATGHAPAPASSGLGWSNLPAATR